MSKINYYKQTSKQNQYSQYINMRITIEIDNYDKHKFITFFRPKFTETETSISNECINYDDLAKLLSDVTDPKLNFSWQDVLQIPEFRAKQPKINGILSEPSSPQKPEEPIFDDVDPQLLVVPTKPIYTEPKLKIHFLNKFIPRIAVYIENLFIKAAKFWFSLELSTWEQTIKNIESVKSQSKNYNRYKDYKEKAAFYETELISYNEALTNWKGKFEEATKKLDDAMNTWKIQKKSFDQLAQSEHQLLTNLKREYEANYTQAIEKVTKTILLSSKYPKSFPREFQVHYDEESKILLIDYQLPDFEKLEIVEKNKSFNFKPVGKTKRKQIIEWALPAIAIRTLCEVAHTDEIEAISSIVFNGWVNHIQKSNGKENNVCILSVHATKADIYNLNITKLEPRECFKYLKGVIAKNVIEYIPVAPILVLNKNDNRIIEGREIIQGLSKDDNLAAMDWNDFEHLIRELFEKEFIENGSEVKITHASHDRGVDAIVYDPDPIKGGKYIIQAKRYTKLVDVSAVRDLYGTIQNENANKGILVTTSHYGPDAYEFAKNKNITLLTGENLLHLLEKHGYKFRIDIKEARKLLNLK